jgi:hypothetical protein
LWEKRSNLNKMTTQEYFSPSTTKALAEDKFITDGLDSEQINNRIKVKLSLIRP